MYTHIPFKIRILPKERNTGALGTIKETPRDIFSAGNDSNDDVAFES